MKNIFFKHGPITLPYMSTQLVVKIQNRTVVGCHFPPDGKFPNFPFSRARGGNCPPPLPPPPPCSYATACTSSPSALEPERPKVAGLASPPPPSSTGFLKPQNNKVRSFRERARSRPNTKPQNQNVSEAHSTHALTVWSSATMTTCWRFHTRPKASQMRNIMEKCV